MIVIEIVVFFLLAIFGLPISIALGVAAIIAILSSDFTILTVAQKMITGIDSFTLVSVPLFLLAGRLMNDGGITDRIFNLARCFVGRVRGGLAHVNVIASMIFAGMSGSAVADAGGLGQVEMKAMHDQGYPDDFSAAITCASSAIGPIIPPSIPMLIFAAMAEASPGRLFIGGIIPGFLMGLSLMVSIVILSSRRNYPRDRRFSFREKLVAMKEAFLPMLTVVIILGGIMTGVFTPTEASAVAVAYSLFLSMVVYRSVKIRDLPKILLDTVGNTAAVMFIVSCSSSFSWVLIIEEAAKLLVGGIYAITSNKNLILLMINAMVLVLGCFLENGVILILVTPLLLPITNALGIDVVHFGVFLVLNLMIGVVTPPVGMSLYTVARISGLSVEKISGQLLPLLIPLVVVLLLTTYIPELSLWLGSVLF